MAVGPLGMANGPWNGFLMGTVQLHPSKSTVKKNQDPCITFGMEEWKSVCMCVVERYYTGP